jgi:hypothetical protein
LDDAMRAALTAAALALLNVLAWGALAWVVTA